MRNEDCQIYIVGGNRIQNELMVDALARETGCRCAFKATLHSIPDRKTPPCCRQRLILVDCNLLDIVHIRAMFRSHAWEMLSCDYRVLFNLIDGSGIEQDGLNNGVRGFFYSGDGLASLLKGICAIFHEEFWIPRKALVDCVLSKPNVSTRHVRPLPGLSFRETEILELLANGCSNKAIADQLCVSPFTVKAHLNHIFRKIEVSSRLQAVRWREQFVADRH